MKNEERIKNIKVFFNSYAQRFNDAINGHEPDVEDVSACFAESFIEASPVGVVAGKNDAEFKKAIPKGYEFYRKIGTSGMEILNKEITLLDDMHSMAKIYWKASYIRQDKSTIAIEFEVFYLMQEKNGIKIFAYITGDEEKVLKNHGLTPYR